jgi:hypothetical protein
MKTEIKLTKAQFDRWLECPDILEMSDDNKWAHLVAESSMPEPKRLYAYMNTVDHLEIKFLTGEITMPNRYRRAPEYDIYPVVEEIK